MSRSSSRARTAWLAALTALAVAGYLLGQRMRRGGAAAAGTRAGAPSSASTGQGAGGKDGALPRTDLGGLSAARARSAPLPAVGEQPTAPITAALVAAAAPASAAESASAAEAAVSESAEPALTVGVEAAVAESADSGLAEGADPASAESADPASAESADPALAERAAASALGMHARELAGSPAELTMAAGQPLAPTRSWSSTRRLPAPPPLQQAGDAERVDGEERPLPTWLRIGIVLAALLALFAVSLIATRQV